MRNRFLELRRVRKKGAVYLFLRKDRGEILGVSKLGPRSALKLMGATAFLACVSFGFSSAQ